MSVGDVDLLVGVCSHSAADKLGEAVQAIERCFQQFFVRQRVVIVNIDGGDKEPPQDDPAASPVANPAQTPKRLSLARASLRSAPSTASRRIIPPRLLQAPLCAPFSPPPFCCLGD